MKKMPACCDMASCTLCRDSPDGWLTLIERQKENRVIRKGECIFEEGQTVRGIYFVYAGIVKVHKPWGHEKQLILHFARKGDMIGYRGLGNKTYPVTATAMETALVCFIPLDFFESCLKVNQPLTYQLLKFYTNELEVAEKRMSDLVHMGVRGRVAATLIMLKNQFGHGKDGFINLTLTRQDMASYAGTTYETVFRVVSAMAREKLVKVSGKAIGILNEPALTALTESDD
jgi:CRP/FNR family transcriptional regulator, polysaccharide utilization system transcription regulator